MALCTLDINEIDSLMERMKAYAGDSEETINDVIHNEGAEYIKTDIQKILPVSGRKPYTGKVRKMKYPSDHPGKRPAASTTQPFRKDDSRNLEVDVKTMYNWHYLYFPDDGETTKRHAGRQHFMLRGAESATPRIIDKCLKRLVNI